MKNHNSSVDHSRGFTLIELLTVIFIIGLLAAILIPTVGRVREKAKVTGAEADLRSLATAMSDYRIEYTTFPPIAGCPVRDVLPGHTYPYIARLGLIDQDKRASFYDRWSESEDLNGNNQLDGLAEDQPQFIVTNTVTKAGYWDWNGELDQGPVPYQYFPVNSDNLRKFRQFLSDNGDPRADNRYDIDILTAPVEDGGAGIEPLDSNEGEGFNTPFYDKFVLFSLGPDQSDHNIVPRNATSLDELRIRAYHRATIDLNGNQAPDFNYRDRIRGTEAPPGAAVLPDFGMPYKRGDSGIIVFMGP